MSHGGAKILWRNPDGTPNRNHDDQVRDAVGHAQKIAYEKGLHCGIGIIDFADATIVFLSERIPDHEVFEMSRPTENSILHGGFGRNPFKEEKA